VPKGADNRFTKKTAAEAPPQKQIPRFGATTLSSCSASDSIAYLTSSSLQSAEPAVAVRTETCFYQVTADDFRGEVVQRRLLRQGERAQG
jgi:hypothetical protein